MPTGSRIRQELLRHQTGLKDYPLLASSSCCLRRRFSSSSSRSLVSVSSQLGMGASVAGSRHSSWPWPHLISRFRAGLYPWRISGAIPVISSERYASCSRVSPASLWP